MRFAPKRPRRRCSRIWPKADLYKLDNRIPGAQKAPERCKEIAAELLRRRRIDPCRLSTKRPPARPAACSTKSTGLILATPRGTTRPSGASAPAGRLCLAGLRTGADPAGRGHRGRGDHDSSILVAPAMSLTIVATELASRHADLRWPVEDTASPLLVLSLSGKNAFDVGVRAAQTGAGRTPPHSSCPHHPRGERDPHYRADLRTKHHHDQPTNVFDMREMRPYERCRTTTPQHRLCASRVNGYGRGRGPAWSSSEPGGHSHRPGTTPLTLQIAAPRLDVSAGSTG